MWRSIRRGRGRSVELDERDALGFLFIMTYGRSGSTLLMGVLNSIPGVLLRGENRDALHHLFHYHRALVRSSQQWKPERTRQRTHPFYGAADFPEGRSLRRIRELVLDTVLRPKPGTRVIGFKEIRWYHEDLEEYVEWLRTVFPGARFVVNTREHAEVMKSGWWTDVPNAAEVLEQREARILALADTLGDAAYRVHYNDYVADPTVLAGLFAWLGEPFDEAAVRAVLQKRHSLGPDRRAHD